MSVRVNGLIAAMTEHSRRLWDHLDQGLENGRVRHHWLAKARHTCNSLETSCRRAGVTLASIAPRSLDAYAWFALLSAPENLQVHLEALRTARTALLNEVPSTESSTVVLLQPMQSLWRMDHRSRPPTHRFSEIFAVADETFWSTFFRAYYLRDMSRAKEALRAFANTPEALEWMAEVDAAIPEDDEAAAGSVYDLEAVFERVNRTCFDSRIERPVLQWTRRLTVRTFGHYQFARDRLTVSRSLDSESVPEFVVDFIMFHELLHKKHGLSASGGRLYAHTPAFRVEERSFPRFDEAQQELGRLARRMRRR